MQLRALVSIVLVASSAISAIRQGEVEKKFKKVPLEGNQYILGWLNRAGGESLRKSFVDPVVPIICANTGGSWLSVKDVALQDTNHPGYGEMSSHCLLVTCLEDSVAHEEVSCPKESRHFDPEDRSYNVDRYIEVSDYKDSRTVGDPPVKYDSRSVKSWFFRIAISTQIYHCDIRSGSMYNPHGLTLPSDPRSAAMCAEDVLRATQTCRLNAEEMTGKSAYWFAQTKKSMFEKLAQKYASCNKFLQASAGKPVKLERAAKSWTPFQSNRYACEQELDKEVEGAKAKCDCTTSFCQNDDSGHPNYWTTSFCTNPLVIKCASLAVQTQLLPAVHDPRGIWGRL